MDVELSSSDNMILLDGLPVETEIAFFSSGGFTRFAYKEVRKAAAASFRGAIQARGSGTMARISDSWDKTDQGVRMTREVEPPEDGLNARVILRLTPGAWKFFVPAACYDSCPNERSKGCTIVSDERTAAPLVMAFSGATQEAITLLRETPAQWSRPRERAPGATRFLHATDIGGIGYLRQSGNGPALVACLPYAEAPSSRMLGKSLDGFTAFLRATAGSVAVTYRVAKQRAETFDEACFLAWQLAWEAYNPQPRDAGLDLRQCMRARAACLEGLARTWKGYTGLALNFDPRVGISSPPRGYGTAFNALSSSIFPSVLEYGFTGRQLSNAFMLHVLGTESGAPEWRNTASRIASSFLQKCATPSGFLHTLYDVSRNCAISPFGDRVGSLLHYGVPGAPSGNYVRNMAEAGFDLCLLSERVQDPGIGEAASRLGGFFIGTQNRDGSWYRAYTEDGRAIRSPEQWFGGSERATKSSTSTPVPFLLKLHALSGETQFLHAARRAGDWLVQEMIQNIDYRGGTLDNPNIVDKEGMAYPMMALASLYRATRNVDYLRAAARAGGLALTWNYLWDVPFERGTRLAGESFKSSGWGGISILWGAGVVDNYSLWFLPDWQSLSSLAGNGVFADASRLILSGTQQLLALPDRMHGLVGAGMQEEGFACSDQGVDDGMIRKGDTWGALGWVFAAGTYPVWRMLNEPGQAGI